jgi:hypothetical protein
VGPRVGLYVIEKRKFLSLPGIGNSGIMGYNIAMMKISLKAQDFPTEDWILKL